MRTLLFLAVALLAASLPCHAFRSSRMLQEDQNRLFPKLPGLSAKIVVPTTVRAKHEEAATAEITATGGASNAPADATTVTPNPLTDNVATTDPETTLADHNVDTSTKDMPSNSKDSSPRVPEQAAASSSSSPPVPSGGCDFYFTGFQDSTPTFKLPENGGDVVISPPIEASVKGSVVNVIALNSQTAKYSGGSSLPDDNQFYVVQDVVQVRTIQPQDKGKYNGLTVTIPITNAEIEVYNQVFNLNPGDGSSSFPEDRRCVVFQTS
ncbi:unnamed protein product [Closterium sp. Yama58-4]|nr:unnamed protein product [Closterium sp. Yama58-4]